MKSETTHFLSETLCQDPNNNTTLSPGPQRKDSDSGQGRYTVDKSDLSIHPI